MGLDNSWDSFLAHEGGRYNMSEIHTSLTLDEVDRLNKLS